MPSLLQIWHDMMRKDIPSQNILNIKPWWEFCMKKRREFTALSIGLPIFSPAYFRLGKSFPNKLRKWNPKTMKKTLKGAAVMQLILENK